MCNCAFSSHGRHYHYRCKDCGECTSCLDEYYMVHDHVFEQALPDRKGMLCLGCLEKRIGRTLTSDDFTGAPINFISKNSDRMMNRLENHAK